MRILACGDIHGEKTKLVRSLLKANLIDKQGKWAAENVTLVFCGDYIDRGPDSKGVIDLLLRLQKEALLKGCVLIFLQGNHEDLIFKALNADHQYLWLANGGYHVFKSYLEDDTNLLWSIGYNKAFKPEILQERILDYHHEFFSQLQTHVVIGNTLFVHAGVNPKTTIETINDNIDHMWIRNQFFNHHTADFLQEQYKVERVVFGHTIHDDVTAYHDGAFLAIDTGSFLEEGKVTIVELGSGLEYKVVGQ
jgi:serine/threonine protein phosphatase 1